MAINWFKSISWHLPRVTKKWVQTGVTPKIWTWDLLNTSEALLLEPTYSVLCIKISEIKVTCIVMTGITGSPVFAAALATNQTQCNSATHPWSVSCLTSQHSVISRSYWYTDLIATVQYRLQYWPRSRTQWGKSTNQQVKIIASYILLTNMKMIFPSEISG